MSVPLDLFKKLFFDTMSKYNTNLASEFYILSVLHRLGKDAFLTLGNKKSVDILIETAQRTITLDVKGMVGTTNWLLDI